MRNHDKVEQLDALGAGGTVALLEAAPPVLRPHRKARV